MHVCILALPWAKPSTKTATEVETKVGVEMKENKGRKGAKAGAGAGGDKRKRGGNGGNAADPEALAVDRSSRTAAVLGVHAAAAAVVASIV